MMLGTVEQPLTIILWGFIAIWVISMLGRAVIAIYEIVSDHREEQAKKRMDDLIKGVRK